MQKTSPQIKIGVFTDTHGNLPALNAILNKFKDIGCDEIFNLGDVVGLGAFPSQCMERILAEPKITNIAGNHELLYLKGIDNILVPIADKEEEAHHKFIHKLLGGRFREELRSWAFQADRQWFGHKISFMHYARKNNRFCAFADDNCPTAEYFDNIFDYVDAQTILFGHEHTPLTLKGKRLYVDVGSLGCNAEAFAKGALVCVTPDGVSITDIKVPYDKQQFFDEMERKQIPRRQFILKNFFGYK